LELINPLTKEIITMRKTGKLFTIKMIILAVSVTFSLVAMPQSNASTGSAEADQEIINRGRYLIKVGDCNGCHTPGYMQSPKSIPESDWLVGDSIGWRGAWGTTYAPNLRISVDQYTETAWVIMVKTREANPPMPWASLNAWSDNDARAVYRYIKSLGLKGDKMPDALPPGVEPTTPYFDLTPKNLPAAAP